MANSADPTNEAKATEGTDGTPYVKTWPGRAGDPPSQEGETPPGTLTYGITAVAGEDR